jgi:hypothetical protein
MTAAPSYTIPPGLILRTEGSNPVLQNDRWPSNPKRSTVLRTVLFSKSRMHKQKASPQIPLEVYQYVFLQ